MREILVYDDYEIHKLGAGGGTQYEEVTTEKATRIDVTDVAKTKGKLIPFGRTTQEGEPSPDYPQEIQNVEGRSCRNLFDGTPYGLVKSTSGFPIRDDTYATIINSDSNNITFKNTKGYGGIESNYIKVRANQTYTLSFQSTNMTNRLIITQYNELKERLSTLNTVTSVTSPITFTATADGYITIAYTNTTEMSSNCILTNIQINEGSTALPYEPYFEGKRLDFIVGNKNIAKEDFDTYLKIVNSGTNRILQESQHKVSQIIEVKPNTTYVIDGKFSGFTDRVCRVRGFKDYPVLGNIDLSTPFAYNNTRFSITTDSSTKYLMIYDSQDKNDINIPEMFVCESTAANPYEEHKEQLIPFPLQDGQKLMEGDYLAEDGVHHVMGQVVLDGTEDCTLRSTNDNGTTTYHYLGFGDYKNAGAIIKALCSHFVYGGLVINGEATKIKGTGFYLYSYKQFPNTRSLYFNVNTEDIPTLNDWKRYIAEQYANGTPVIIEYELAEEIIDPYTEAQQEAYNKLKNLKLYKGVNHIWTETEGLEPNLQLTYKRIKQEGVLQVSNIQQLNNLELNNTEETPEELTPEIYEE